MCCCHRGAYLLRHGRRPSSLFRQKFGHLAWPEGERGCLSFEFEEFEFEAFVDKVFEELEEEGA
jgi:hypothetical protein